MRRVLASLLVTGCLALIAPVLADDVDTSPKARTDALGDPLPPAALARLGSQRFVHGPGLHFVTFAKDDRTLFSVGTSSVRCWETATGKEHGAFEFAADEHAAALAVSADARFVACSADAHVTIRDLHTGKALQRVSTRTTTSHLAFGPEARSVVWSSPDGTLHLSELTGDRKTREFKGMQQVRSLALSADGKLLATLLAGQDRAILYDVASGKRLRQYTVGENRHGQPAITGIALHPDGKLLYATTSEGTVIAWETDSLEERYHLERTPGGLTTMALSPDGKWLAVGVAAGGIKLVNATNGKFVRTIDAQILHGSIAFSRDGKSLAVAGDDGRVRLWDVTTGKAKIVTRDEGIVSAAFGKQGKEIVTSSPGRITHWSLTGKAERRVEVGDAGETNAVLSPCGRYALRTHSEGELRLIETEKGEARKAFPGIKADQVGAAAFDHAGRYLAVLGGEGANVVTLYSPLTGKKLRQLEMATEGKSGAALLFSPDGRTLCLAHPIEGTLQRWEVATGKKRQPFRFPAGLRYAETSSVDSEPAPGVIVSPDGRLVAVLREERVCLCDAWQSKLLRSLDGAESALVCAAFTPDGKLIAAGGTDQKVCLWEVATCKLVATLRGHRGSVTSLTFSPDGKSMLSCSADGTALLWSVAEALKLPTKASQKPRTPEALWAELASEDGAAAELAMREMVSTPEATVAWLAKHLEAVKEAERATLNRLVEQLDSDNQGAREDATRQLIALEEQARAVVEAALKSESAEVRKLAARILAQLDQAVSGTEARPLRSVEVLELIGDAAAKKVLTRLAEGAAEARLTKEAAAALARLEARE